jgi:uncharacterized RDD family membrane protein YckC
MEIVTVHTTQNIDIDYEVGGLGERIVARLIDTAGLILPMLVLGLIIGPHLDQTGVIVMMVIFGVIYIFYDLVCEVFFNGQSFGKKVMKIRVISLDGGRPRLSQFLLRWLFRIVDFIATGGVAALVTAIVTDKSQRLGDLVAGTVLIRTVPRTQINKVGYVATQPDYNPVFQQAEQLTDSDVALIHEVVNNYMRTGNNVAVYQLADKIRSHMSLTLPPEMNSMQFLQTLLKDYSHITSHADMVL